MPRGTSGCRTGTGARSLGTRFAMSIGQFHAVRQTIPGRSTSVGTCRCQSDNGTSIILAGCPEPCFGHVYCRFGTVGTLFSGVGNMRLLTGTGIHLNKEVPVFACFRASSLRPNPDNRQRYSLPFKQKQIMSEWRGNVLPTASRHVAA